LREADLSGLTLADVKLFQGAWITPRQAAELISELGLRVA
jgi:fluoroquinolone resistance protein